MTLAAIETSYKGYRFRSRLEARWAVFFEALGCPWGYEVEGFQTTLGWYLPDFCITGRTGRNEVGGPFPALLFIEVKPAGHAADPRVEELDAVLVRERKGRAFQVNGDPYDALGVSEGAYDDMGYHEMYPDGWRSSEQVLAAATLARGARFEHGEAPL